MLQKVQSLSNSNILVTGGFGYIGSHTVVELLQAGYTVTVVDNLSNSSILVQQRIHLIVGQQNAARLYFHKVDLLNGNAMDQLFSENSFDAVIHFAGKKAVGESTQIPLFYYDNNVCGTCSLLQTMAKHGCKKIVFSSSATVYGEPTYVPIDEKHSLQAINPYGRTKLFIEEMMRDLADSDSEWCISVLRYFNPIGAHESGLIGEDPKGIPNNLMPFVQQVAVGRREELSIFGNDYDTPDGTCIRDYIHVVDLAKAHTKALAKIVSASKYGCKSVNVGTGVGTSVFQMVKAFERASGLKIATRIAPRRAGDAMTVFALPTLAKEEYGWSAEKTIEDSCVDQWRWASNNPYGYTEELSDELAKYQVNGKESVSNTAAAIST